MEMIISLLQPHGDEPDYSFHLSGGVVVALRLVE